jgi:hypothetical protein
MAGLLALHVLLFWGCGEAACTDDAYRCTGDMLAVCEDGVWVDDEDCTESAMVCHDMGDDSHCMTEGSM